MSHKPSHKDITNLHDPFLDSATEGAVWAKSHKRLAMIVGSVILASIIGFSAWHTYSTRRQETWGAAFGKAMQTMEATVGEKPEQTAENTKPAQNAQHFATDKEKYTQARKEFQNVVQLAGSSKGVGVLARFYVADLSERLGETDEALKQFEHLVKTLPTQDNLFFLAVERLAYLQENKGQLDAAVATFKKIAPSTENFYAVHAMIQQIRLLVAKGDTAAATAIANDAKKRFPDAKGLEPYAHLITIKPEPKPTATSKAP